MDGQTRYAGLTASERLTQAGVKADFDAAAQARRRGEMIRFLRQVEIENPDWLADMIIANPRRYGY